MSSDFFTFSAVIYWKSSFSLVLWPSMWFI